MKACASLSACRGPWLRPTPADAVALGVLRDADETKEWIEEKNQALNTDNYGHDLASVQALQRKHEGFERDLAALGDKVWSPPPRSAPAVLLRD